MGWQDAPIVKKTGTTKGGWQDAPLVNAPIDKNTLAQEDIEVDMSEPTGEYPPRVASKEQVASDLFETYAGASEVLFPTVVGIGTTALTKSPLAGMAASGATEGALNLANQKAGESLGVREPMDNEAALKSAAVSGGGAFLAEGVGGLVAKGGRKLGRAAFGGEMTPEAERASRITGTKLLPSQADDTYKAGFAETLYAKAPVIRDAVYLARNQKNLKELARTYDEAVAKMSSDPRVKQHGFNDFIGDKIETAYKRLVTAATKARTAAGAKEFGELARFGDAGRIRVDNLIDTLETGIKKNTGPGQTDTMRRKAKAYRDMLKTIVKDEKSGRTAAKLHPLRVNELLSEYGSAAGGGNTIFAKLPKDAKQRQAATEIYGALMDDLKVAANRPGIPGDIAKQLEKARTSWLIHTRHLERLGQTRLSQIVGNKVNQGEDVFNAMARMQPARLRQAIKHLDKYDPGISNEYRARFLQTLRDESQEPGAMFNAGKFEQLLHKNQHKFEVLIPDKKARNEIESVLDVLTRINKTQVPGMSGSLATIATGGGVAYMVTGLPGLSMALGGLIGTSAPILLVPSARNAILKFGAATTETAARAAFQKIARIAEQEYLERNPPEGTAPINRQETLP